MNQLVFENKFPCANSLECRFWDEGREEWSSEGCTTRVFKGNGGDSFIGCETSHLTDFVAVKVPTEARGDIHFGFIDAFTLRATNVQATYGGLWLTLHKRQNGATPVQSELRIAYTKADGVPIGWELLNLTCPATTASASAATAAEAVKPCAWLHVRAGMGRIFGNDTDECVQSRFPKPSALAQPLAPRHSTQRPGLVAWLCRPASVFCTVKLYTQLRPKAYRGSSPILEITRYVHFVAAAEGLAEATAAGAYVATVWLRLLYEDGATVEAVIDVHASVYADVRAARSVLGTVSAAVSHLLALALALALWAVSLVAFPTLIRSPPWAGAATPHPTSPHRSLSEKPTSRPSACATSKGCLWTISCRAIHSRPQTTVRSPLHTAGRRKRAVVASAARPHRGGTWMSSIEAARITQCVSRRR